MFVIITFLLSLITGCSISGSEQQFIETTKNPNANETLELQADADIFHEETMSI